MDTPYSTTQKYPTEYELWCDLYAYANDIKNETLRQKLQQARPHWHYVHIRTSFVDSIIASMGVPASALRTDAAGSPLYATHSDVNPAQAQNDLPAQNKALQGIVARSRKDDTDVVQIQENSVTNKYTIDSNSCQEVGNRIETICYQRDRETCCATSDVVDISNIVNLLSALVKQYEGDNTVYSVEVMSLVGQLVNAAKEVIE